MTDRTRESLKLLGLVGVFLLLFYLPAGSGRFRAAVSESLQLARWYAREHVLLCLVPAFFIAGAIAVFVGRESVMRYLGPRANKALAYGVASVSGSILAVCSCTVLPLFAGIWRMGAGLGPAVAFLYSGPAINVLAIILTARVLGPGLGIARAVGAIVFAVVIGLAMHLVYRREELGRAEAAPAMPAGGEPARPLWQNAAFFSVLVGVLVFANWGAPGEGASGSVWAAVWRSKWLITACFGAALALVLVLWMRVAWWKVLPAAAAPAALAVALPTDGLWVLLPFAAGAAGLSAVLATSEGDSEGRQWLDATWGFAKQILPLLLLGVLVAGFLLGRPGREGLVPARYVGMLVGESPDQLLTATGWSGGAEAVVRAVWPVWTNLFAAVFGALMYFATLTEIPILQGLIGAGMGKGPALSLLLAGPAVSLPNLLVIRGIMGTGKTAVFCLLVVAAATLSGLAYGAWF